MSPEPRDAQALGCPPRGRLTGVCRPPLRTQRAADQQVPWALHFALTSPGTCVFRLVTPDVTHKITRRPCRPHTQGGPPGLPGEVAGGCAQLPTPGAGRRLRAEPPGAFHPPVVGGGPGQDPVPSPPRCSPPGGARPRGFLSRARAWRPPRSRHSPWARDGFRSLSLPFALPTSASTVGLCVLQVGGTET